jgi:hypothetical protein
MTRSAILTGFVLMVLGVGGCTPRTPPVTEVEGVVLLDGTPLPDVLVEFVPEDDEGRRLPFSQGRTDSHGHYQLQCENAQLGAVVGLHKVMVRRPTARPDPETPAPASKGPAIPLVYQSVVDTPLTVVVKSGEKTHNLALKSD